jgi:hypothetical protein
MDIRFAANVYQEVLRGAGGEHRIRLTGATWPLQLRVTGLAGLELQAVDGLSGGKTLCERIVEGRTISLSQTALGGDRGGSGLLVVRELNSAAAAFELSQNYPNPFNPVTVIGFSLPEAGEVVLEVYSVLGQKVETLLHGCQTAGRHEVEFNALKLASGTYFYRLQAGRNTAVRKFVVVK